MNPSLVCVLYCPRNRAEGVGSSQHLEQHTFAPTSAETPFRGVARPEILKLRVVRKIKDGS